MSDNAAAAPRALRTIISIVGRRNAGKSSLINALCGQEIAIVSDQAGTTTDAVAKPYELLPLGPVTFYDTAGLDDESSLGKQRIKATRKVLFRSDIALMVIGADGLQNADKQIIEELQKLNIPFAAVFNKTDIYSPCAEDIQWLKHRDIAFTNVSAQTGSNIEEVKKLIISLAPAELKKDTLLAGDLFKPQDIIVLVVPIDFSAPKGRLILPQVQVLREALDCSAKAIVVKDSELVEILQELKRRPALIITDSQAIMKVAPIVPQDIPLTTFSILFARNKGDLDILYQGASTIDQLADGDKVLIAEACSHHSLSDDIGKVKLPNWLKKYTGKDLQFSFCQGSDFPDDLEQYKLVIHCGACMLNRMEMLRRLHECIRRGVPITNYGIAISKTQGVLERTIKPLLPLA